MGPEQAMLSKLICMELGGSCVVCDEECVLYICLYSGGAAIASLILRKACSLCPNY